jgi:hypothetical protein
MTGSTTSGGIRRPSRFFQPSTTLKWQFIGESSSHADVETMTGVGSLT